MFPNTTAHRVYREKRLAKVLTNVLDIGLSKQEVNRLPKIAWQAGLKDSTGWSRDFLAAGRVAP